MVSENSSTNWCALVCISVQVVRQVKSPLYHCAADVTIATPNTVGANRKQMNESNTEIKKKKKNVRK